MTEIKQLTKLFEQFSYAQSYATAFTEMLDWMLLPFKMCDTQEEQKQALERYQGHPKTGLLVKLLTEIGDLSEGYRDPLGELYMQLISQGRMGQYFTPEPICDMIAAMQVGDNSQPKQTVLDPACGSGRMLLSAAKLNRHMRFYGADLDNTCCKMALLNMLLNSLTGEIACMDSLSNEFHVGYKLHTTLVDGYHTPYYVEFTDSELSNICLKALKVEPVFDTAYEPVSIKSGIGIQGSLF
ncbi:MAG: SAM-dependent DNA methyltransferase [Flavobacterium sp.]|nr:MAG: SAM-dependent DNA methyltransferase [Flavobacterium sp.]